MDVKINYSVNETMALLNIGRSKLYEELNSGRLSAIKLGRKTLIPYDSIRAWNKQARAYAPSRGSA